MAARREGQTPDVEILVHVTAPSRTADDAVYRQLAQSYLSFQPRGRFAISAVPDLEHQDESTQLASEEEVAVSQEQFGAASSSNIDFAAVTSGQPWVPESQDLSFRSVYDNRYSPPLQEKRSSADTSPLGEHDESFSTQPNSPWQAPPSEVNDSYPIPDAEIRNTPPTRVLEHYLRNLPSSSLPRVSSTGQAPNVDRSSSLASAREVNIPSSIPIPLGLGEAISQSLGYEDDAKVIPVTPRVPDGPTRKREEFSPTVIDETIYISNSVIGTASEAASFRAESAPPLSKRQKGLADEAKAANLHRSSSDTGPAGNERPKASSSVVVKDSSDILEIRPPSPPAGITDLEPEDLVSDKLAKLARDLSSRYRPRESRPMEPFERGYWLVDCTGWSQDTRSEAWIFLANYLRSGLAGWGVWCRRDESHDWIRLYCWAHVAKHSYLLLYLASGRHLKVNGAKWIGGDGEVVLEVPPAEK